MLTGSVSNKNNNQYNKITMFTMVLLLQVTETLTLEEVMFLNGVIFTLKGNALLNDESTAVMKVLHLW